MLNDEFLFLQDAIKRTPAAFSNHFYGFENKKVAKRYMETLIASTFRRCDSDLRLDVRNNWIILEYVMDLWEVLSFNLRICRNGLMISKLLLFFLFNSSSIM